MGIYPIKCTISHSWRIYRSKIADKLWECSTQWPGTTALTSPQVCGQAEQQPQDRPEEATLLAVTFSLLKCPKPAISEPDCTGEQPQPHLRYVCTLLNLHDEHHSYVIMWRHAQYTQHRYNNIITILKITIAVYEACQYSKMRECVRTVNSDTLWSNCCTSSLLQIPSWFKNNIMMKNDADISVTK